jgi:hypothetical protein
MLPSDGTCRAITAWSIREGAFGDVRLDGLHLGMIISWPGAIHHGGGHAIVCVDERGDARQRDALARIGRGEAGEGGPFAIFAGTFAEPARVAFVPFVFEHDEWTGRLRLGDLAEAEIGPLRSDMDGSHADAHIVLPSGFIFRDARMRNAIRCEARALGPAFSHEGSNAFFSDVAYNV